MVNSYHHQGVKRLAKSFRPMAKTTDGLLEGFYDPKALFTVGLQFHPERMLPEYKGNLRVWEAFTNAIKLYALKRQGEELYKNGNTALSKATEMKIKIASIFNQNKKG